MELVLASTSPRRRALLQHLTPDFHVHAVPVVENAPERLSVQRVVEIIARKKALAASHRHEESFTLGADTIIALDGRILGKPKDAIDARIMLADLADREHDVVTGLALVWEEEVVDDMAVTTKVRMDRLPREVLDAYIESGSWADKAGGYAIQDKRLAPYLHIVEGPWTNVVGLPLHATADLLRRNGVPCADAPDEEWVRSLPL